MKKKFKFVFFFLWNVLENVNLRNAWHTRTLALKAKHEKRKKFLAKNLDLSGDFDISSEQQLAYFRLAAVCSCVCACEREKRVVCLRVRKKKAVYNVKKGRNIFQKLLTLYFSMKRRIYVWRFKCQNCCQKILKSKSS